MLRLPLLAPAVVLASACANLLEYDEITIREDAGTGAVTGGSAGSAGGGTSTGGSAGTGGSGGEAGAGGEAGGSGGSAAGGTSTGGTGGGDAGGTTGGSGGTGGTSSGGTSSGGTSSGGTSSGGTSSGGTSSGGTSSGGTTGAHQETKTETGATGNEPGGIIPVCCVPSATEKAGIDQVFLLLNQHRLANGKSALAYDLALEAAITGHCHHMVIHSFSAHDAPEAVVDKPWTRATLCGAGSTTYSGENIYWGSSDPTAPMNWWKTSPGHNANMLSGNFKRVGIGNYGTRWGQLFGG